MRKLATIREVEEIMEIEGADRIERARVGGWWCIVKKGEFTVGDTGVYFEIDSLLPNAEPFLFLGKPKLYKGVELYRVKTMKMRKVLSQGLLLPISMFKSLPTTIGTDVSKELGVIKYDTENFNGNNGGKSGVNSKRNFPSFLQKTDQERIQNVTKYFDIHKDVVFEETLKLDGSSYTAYKVKDKLPWYKKLVNQLVNTEYFKGETFGVCSRNIELKYNKDFKTADNFSKVTITNNIEKELPVGYAIQGELLAPNIQKNHEKVGEPTLYIFDVLDIKQGKKLGHKERIAFIADNFSTLQHVPIVSVTTIFTECDTIDKLLSHVEGQSINKGTISEGRVYKSLDGSITFKAISNKYLLKEK